MSQGLYSPLTPWSAILSLPLPSHQNNMDLDAGSSSVVCIFVCDSECQRVSRLCDIWPFPVWNVLNVCEEECSPPTRFHVQLMCAAETVSSSYIDMTADTVADLLSTYFHCKLRHFWRPLMVSKWSKSLLPTWSVKSNMRVQPQNPKMGFKTLHKWTHLYNNSKLNELSWDDIKNLYLNCTEIISKNTLNDL